MHPVATKYLKLFQFIRRFVFTTSVNESLNVHVKMSKHSAGTRFPMQEPNICWKLEMSVWTGLK